MLDIKRVGLDRYARDAQVLMLAWAFDDDEPSLWLPYGDEPVWSRRTPSRLIPHEVFRALKAPDVVKTAWNAAFERSVFYHALGYGIPVEQWFDPAVMARYGTFPNHLLGCSEYLKLGDQQKDAVGKRLIQKFSKPFKGKFRDPKDHAEDWELFKDYCKQDVRAERAVEHTLEKAFSLTPFEMEVMRIDAEINETGMPTDMLFVTEAKKLVDAEKAALREEMQRKTGLDNPNSGPQLLPWLRQRGYPFASLLKKRVDQALLKEDLDPLVRDVLCLKCKLSRSSTSKLDAIIDRVGPDGILRNSYMYLGANRTGRWSGKGVQLQNLPR